jgi:hypothetical protein
MLKHTSVGSSTPQVRSGVGMRRFNTDMTPYMEILESMIFPSYNIVKETSQRSLEQNTYHVWKRPAHLRAHWLILSDKSPALLVDIRNSDNVYSIKFPYDNRQVQKVGPIVCEAAYDSQEATLWIWDLVFLEQKNLWSGMPYSKRWDLLQKVVRPLIYDSHPMCDISIRYPEWKSMKNFALETDEVGYSYEFQPELAGQKRLLWLLPKANDTFRAANFHEREMISHTTCAIIPDDTDPLVKVNKVELNKIKPNKVEPNKVELNKVELNKVEPKIHEVKNKYINAFLLRDTLSKLPDTYKLTSEDNIDLGLAAISSMEMSSKLRRVGPEGCKVEIQWYEPFQKYEVRRIINK